RSSRPACPRRTRSGCRRSWRARRRAPWRDARPRRRHAGSPAPRPRAGPARRRARPRSDAPSRRSMPPRSARNRSRRPRLRGPRSGSRPADPSPVSIAILAGGVATGIPLAQYVACTRIPMGLRGVRILVIEDAQDIREVFTLLLRAEGADVASAANGREATDLVAAQRFDVVLSDLGLPDIPGDVLIRELRARSGRATRVVVVTGYGEPFLARARQAG